MIFPSDAGLSSIPYFENVSDTFQKDVSLIEHNQNIYTISIHADVLKIKRKDAPAPSHGIFRRGKVSGFSDKSRKRMIETLASIVDTPDFFMTLTFSDDVAFRPVAELKADFELLRHWLQYNYDGITAIWKMEIETRKSGEFIGRETAHFHLLIWMPKHLKDVTPSLLKDGGKLWREYWHNITGSTNQYHLLRYGLRLEEIKSRRHAYHYASKYVAKVDDDTQSWGRRWGRIGELDTLPVFEMEISYEQYKELRRLIISYWKRRSKFISKKLSRQSVNVGLTSFRLGAWNDINHGLEKSTIWKMIFHAIEIVLHKKSDKRKLLDAKI